MLYLIIGLIVFLGLHSLPMFTQTRADLVGRFGEGGYKGVYSLLSAIGLGLVVYGYGLARVEGSPVLYYPPEWTRHITMLFMVPVFILLIGAYVQGRVKKTFRHPMLLAVKIWAFSHLLVRGDLASILLFGGFLAWAVVDRISVKRRAGGAQSADFELTEANKRAEIAVILIGLILYGLFVWKGHELVIGVPLT
jgi:uncharacterized membrane protein